MEEAILRTLAYADIFDYPLKKEEIWQWLIGKQATGNKQKEVEKKLKENSFLMSRVSCLDGHCCLKGRGEIVRLREQRRGYSIKKMKLAGKVAGIMRLIPWIKMVGVTGALAMKNSDKEDDIDLLIVTSKNRLWLTRALTVFLVELVARRRRPGDQKVKDKICLNMFLDEKHLSIPKKERDLFSAHEVCQLRPIFIRGDTYSRFLQENSWVRGFLPNVYRGLTQIKDADKRRISVNQFKNQRSSAVEQLAKRVQLWYMRNRRTTEKITEGIIRFHPQDAREWVLKEYQARLEKLMIK